MLFAHQIDVVFRRVDENSSGCFAVSHCIPNQRQYDNHSLNSDARRRLTLVRCNHVFIIWHGDLLLGAQVVSGRKWRKIFANTLFDGEEIKAKIPCLVEIFLYTCRI